MNSGVTPLVSVIITTYHNEKLLKRAVESVFHQTYKRIELIVVDDNPPESDARKATEAVMKKYPQAVYLKHSENRNGAAARNTGIRAAKGEYIAFLDNDDVYFSEHVADCVKILEGHPECGAVLCGVVKVGGGICWDLIPAVTGDAVKEVFLRETALGTGSNIFARTFLVKEIKGFDESFQRHQDVEFCIRLFSKCRIFSLPEVQIVKGMDGFSNTPDFDGFLRAKKHFMDKFRGTIEALYEQDQKRYFSGQYSSLLYAACREGNREKIQWSVSELQKYRNLSGKEYLLVGLSKIHAFFIYEKIKRFIKWGKSGNIYRKVTKSLGDYDRQMFSDILKG